MCLLAAACDAWIATRAAGQYARLGQVKAQYDPENLFRMHHNITPLRG
jgi:FAD/FMN-containing dehydrogenase